MAARNKSSWTDRDEHKTFKCDSKAASKHPFSILLIGSSNWSSQLTDTIIEYCENNHNSKIEVHKANSVKSALITLSNVYADLVIILMDVRKNDCLLETETNLLALEPTLLCGRTVLVNPLSDIKRKDMGITYENIDTLKKKFNLLIIHGNIEIYLNRTFLVRRIMILTSTVYQIF